MSEILSPNEPMPDSKPVRPSGVCRKCGAASLSKRTRLLLCEPCFVRRLALQVPPLIKVAGAVIAILILLSALRLPNAIRAAVHFRAGRDHELRLEYREAKEEYALASAFLPHAIEVRVRLATVAYRLGEFATARQALDSLSGDEMREDVAHDVLMLSTKLKEAADEPAANQDK